MHKYKNLNDFVKPHTVGEVDVAFLDHLFGKIDQHIKAGGKILILTLTKKSSEEITNFFISKGYKAFYLHSEIDTINRREIIKKLKSGEIDMIIGINLLREGIDLPEVSLIAILDADKQGFLRSTTALIQIIGRASRNPKGEVVLYADSFTQAIVKSLRETYRRRNIQNAHNKKNNITPMVATSNVKSLEIVKTDDNYLQNFDSLTRGKNKRLKRMTKKEKDIISKKLKAQMDELIKERKFEEAAIVRDQIKELEGDEYS